MKVSIFDIPFLMFKVIYQELKKSPGAKIIDPDPIPIFAMSLSSLFVSSSNFFHQGQITLLGRKENF